LLAEAQPSPNAKPLRVKSTRISPNVQVAVKAKPKRKAKAVRQTTQVVLPKPVKKSAPKTLGQIGKSKTPVRQTPQVAKPAPKRKRSLAK
jgi:hypothetical protein